ncbi:MAG: acyl-CoA dehydratase activase-related protein [archaeon]|jgi:activator of 2-hydroxyglutaryl-CoA dehydratase/predicted nucleotide-binding protein (sugar kinase/HSP70/actin superfamily)
MIKIFVNPILDNKSNTNSTLDIELTFWEIMNESMNQIIIDAGIANIHIRITKDFKNRNIVIPNNDEIKSVLKKHNLLEDLKTCNQLYITGKLAGIIQKNLKQGYTILPSAAVWEEAKFRITQNAKINTLGIIDLSASGYIVIAVDKNGNLKDDLLVTNPHCGAGSGINLSRILEKLNIAPEKVDSILAEYLGEEGKNKRLKISIRSDRCGVFSSSATISDKNQGIPLQDALAVTMKSEVLKACKKMPEGIDTVYLTGRVFLWQFMQDCAKDYLESIGTKEIIFDQEQETFINGVQHLVEEIGPNNLRKQNKDILSKKESFLEYPSFKELKEKYETAGLFKRINFKDELISCSVSESMPINIGLDVGSTMAKMVISDARNNKLLFRSSYNNHGDTIETIKHIFGEIKKKGITKINIQNIGITGSGRYQVQNVLRKVYPNIENRIFVLVENYAHARGSIDYAKEHIQNLKERFPEINHEFCVLIDIGGEDTKVSTISLIKEELFDNVMNIKCSAGTGSLMDTLKSLFGIEDINDACTEAFNAKKAYEINATCAVFLMENAQKMQSLGFGKDEILASCNYAIVENMARTLWNQIEFPKNALVLLHGQTMLSDPLPLAVTHRLQEGGEMYALIPPLPGHRACLGLINSIKDKEIIETECILDDLINLKFSKRIIQCRGVACGDKNACCSRTMLTYTDKNKETSLLLGGCTSVNELAAGKTIEKNTLDAYQKIWEYIDSKLPKSKDKNRLIIPRSFAVSEHAFFLSQIFEYLDIPVYVDNVIEQDILNAQPLFSIDVCAPLIGAVGQYIRLAKEEHGIILVPQIDFLPTDSKSLGRTCTTNQGGVAIAKNFAKSKYPKSNFYLFDLSIKKLDAEYLSEQLYDKLKTVFQFYNITVTKEYLRTVINKALKKNQQLKNEIADLTTEILEKAIEENRNISVVCGREYILNPDIYDSHVGKLLKDKGIVALPSYVLETELDDKFNYIYWRNPQDLITKINAIANNKLYQIVKNENLSNVLKKIETGLTNSSLSVIQVSTFRCGPDTVIMPTISEIVKKRPSLLIQSDAMIKELAHLENRVNTYINQLNKKLHSDLGGNNFEIKILEEFDAKGLNRDTDVIYFPTLDDNRGVISVFRASGLVVFDNYADDSYDLEKKIKLGRKYAGDSVCAPLAGVFADMILAVEDFKKRKKDNDPLVEGKTRILVFDNKGTGPCRQGQYFEMHKLLLYQKFSCNNSCQKLNVESLEPQIKIIVGHERDNYNVGLEEWALIQSFQGLILQGVLHSMLLKYGANCFDFDQYQEFYQDYLKLKKEIYKILEEKTKPSEFTLKSITKINQKSIYGGAISKYFGYGLYRNNGIRAVLKNFSKKWTSLQKNQAKDKFRIHIEGEAYMRAAQAQDIFYALVDSIGFQTFEVNYSPLWSYMELILEFNILDIQDKIAQSKNKLEIKKLHNSLFRVRLVIRILRNILAKPLYDAGQVDMPDDMKKVLNHTKALLPSLKPRGELPPYVGEAILKIDDGIDLFLNVAPEGCMVSSMGQLFGHSILEISRGHSRIQDLFSLNGEVDFDKLQTAILKSRGPNKYYKQDLTSLKTPLTIL